MKKHFTFILAFALTAGLHATDYTKFVNPFIGTQTDSTGALSGSTFPGASLPQGLIQVGPEMEQHVTYDPCCGYDYNKDKIFGFTHTHLSGTGCTDLIDISFMPTTSPVTEEKLSEGLFPQHYSHDKESAVPGYYSVTLLDEDIKAEFSATVHAGIHRYTFPAAKKQQLILDLDRMTFRGESYYSGRRAYQIIQSQIRIVDDHTIEGFRVLTGWAKMRKVYFRAEFSRPIKSHLMMDDKRSVQDGDIVNGRMTRAALTFDNSASQEVMVKVSLSAVDAMGARQNMKAEAESWNFESYTNYFKQGKPFESMY